jgi:hypothetical protein
MWCLDNISGRVSNKTLRNEHSVEGLVEKQIQKAITSSINIGMEYVDAQFVGVKDHTYGEC